MRPSTASRSAYKGDQQAIIVVDLKAGSLNGADDIIWDRRPNGFDAHFGNKCARERIRAVKTMLGDSQISAP